MGSAVVVRGLSCPTAGEISRTRDWISVACLARRILNHWTTKEAWRDDIWSRLWRRVRIWMVEPFRKRGSGAKSGQCCIHDIWGSNTFGCFTVYMFGEGSWAEAIMNGLNFSLENLDLTWLSGQSALKFVQEGSSIIRQVGWGDELGPQFSFFFLLYFFFFLIN